MVDPRFPSALIDEDALAGASVLAEAAGDLRLDTLVVLGSGLASALDGWGPPRARLPLSSLPGVSAPVADGHVDELLLHCREGVGVLVALGRTHLYEGAAPSSVTALARVAAAAGVRRAVLCNANGCLRDWSLGDVMAIEDHLNFSGSSPFDGPLFIDVSHVWSPELTNLLAGICQRRGSYALLRGPEYQTRAETRWLASTGADCVGMSTVMEAITLHSLGVEVCGMSVVSDLSFATEATDPTAVVEAAARACDTIVAGIDAILARPAPCPE